jgi:hypothetical protein
MRSLGVLALLLASVFLSPPPANADGPQTGTIDGQVTDAQGQPLPGVTVNLSGPQVTRSTVTDDEGRYRFALLQAGRYTVGATLEGMGSVERAAELESGVRQEVDLTLSGQTAEEITVTSEVPMISKYEVGATASLENEVAESVAFRSRLYGSSVRMLPGVINVAGAAGVGDEDAAPAINGGSQGEVGAFLEGVDTSMPRRGGELRFAVPTTAVADTRLEAAGFGAEYGRATSGVINSTIKTGTNTFHGEGLYVGQNTKWRAAYEELDIPRPDDQINSYELNLGGPLVRDRAWFFAAYASLSSNELDTVPSGEVLNTSREFTPAILKLNFQPGERHQIALTGIDSPSDAIFVPVQNIGDIYGLTDSINDQTLYTGTWSFAITSATFLEVKGAQRREDTIRGVLYQREVDPNASPDSPLGNNYRYLDLQSGIRYNAAGTPLGNGFNKFPRDQANISATHFAGNHELKFGADYQDVAFDNLTDIGQEYRGRGYNVNLPGGYATPQNKRIYTPAAAPGGIVHSPSETWSGFAQDRLDVGDHWAFTFGVRVDDQTVENDIGEEVIAYTEWAPRASAVYDIHADGRLLARATAGRYYRNVGVDIATREFARLASGANEYDQYLWNSATQRYDRFQQHIAPINEAQIPDLDPMYKDEVSAGFDWQFSDNWAFNSQVVWSEMGDLFWSTDQFDSTGQVVTDVRNRDGGFREYRGISLELNRSFREGWAVRSNYTWGEAEGNVDFNTDDDDLFEGLGGREVCAVPPYPGCVNGRTDTTSINRAGRNSWDREHAFNLVGIKRWEFGKQSIGAGAYFFYRSGARWGLRPSTTLVHPTSGQTITTSTYTEPRDANQLEDTYQVSFSADWSFPIAGDVRGKVGGEVSNVTNEQEVVVINLASGQPSPGIIAYEVPREFRLTVGVTF